MAGSQASRSCIHWCRGRRKARQGRRPDMLDSPAIHPRGPHGHGRRRECSGCGSGSNWSSRRRKPGNSPHRRKSSFRNRAFGSASLAFRTGRRRGRLESKVSVFGCASEPSNSSTAESTFLSLTAPPGHVNGPHIGSRQAYRKPMEVRIHRARVASITPTIAAAFQKPRAQLPNGPGPSGSAPPPP